MEISSWKVFFIKLKCEKRGVILITHRWGALDWFLEYCKVVWQNRLSFFFLCFFFGRDTTSYERARFIYFLLMFAHATHVPQSKIQKPTSTILIMLVGLSFFLFSFILSVTRSSFFAFHFLYFIYFLHTFILLTLFLFFYTFTFSARFLYSNRVCSKSKIRITKGWARSYLRNQIFHLREQTKKKNHSVVNKNLWVRMHTTCIRILSAWIFQERVKYQGLWHRTDFCQLWWQRSPCLYDTSSLL